MEKHYKNKVYYDGKGYYDTREAADALLAKLAAKEQTDIDDPPYQTIREVADQLQDAMGTLKQHPRLADEDDDLNAKYRKTYIEGAPFDPQSNPALHARVESANVGIRPVDSGDWSVRFSDKATQKITGPKTYSGSIQNVNTSSAAVKSTWSGLGDYSNHTAEPWDDPLKDQIAKAERTVACCDDSEIRPDYNPNIKPKVYFHDRWPSLTTKDIIKKAVELIVQNKKIDIHLTHSFIDPEAKKATFIVSLIDIPPFRKLIHFEADPEIFERNKYWVDTAANLRAKVDTNTYITLRLAYLIYRTVKYLEDKPIDKNVLRADYLKTEHFKVTQIDSCP